MKIIPFQKAHSPSTKPNCLFPLINKLMIYRQDQLVACLVEIQPFVVITSKDILLLDTGLGFSEREGKMQFHKNLAEAGINPAEITKVLMSHLHKDHAGGISEDMHRNRLCFPDATYYIQQREFDFAFEKGFPSFIPEELEVLKNSNRLIGYMKTKE